MEFGEKLKTLRTERSWTQEQLASKLYVTRTAVSKWETGGGSPNLDSLQAIARLFGVSVDDLLSADDLIVLADNERRSSVRRGGLLSFGLLDVLMIAFAFLPLYSVLDGSFVRMAGLGEYGAAVDFGASFILIVAAVVAVAIVGAVEVAFSFMGSQQTVPRIALIGLAIQVAAVAVFIVTREPYAAALAFAFLVTKAVIGYRVLRS